MEPVDRDDPRPPSVQVAASIRADILSGDLSAGTRLPSQDELAQTLGVARMTVQSAMRTLQNEGFVTIRAGSGVYVTERTFHSVTDGHPLEPVANMIFEMGNLKRLTRSGWAMLGVAEAETVAEHSFRAAVIGIMLASMEGAEIGRTAAMCVLHDSAESRIGDINAATRAYLTAARPEAVSVDQTAGMPEVMGDTLRGLVAEFEEGKTLEARCAKDADKLELLATAREYARHGYDTAEWQQTSAEAIRTASGQVIAQAILNTSPAEWWQPFARSYHEIKARSKRRAKS
jgi:putative hydrolases of HD superfamily